jgi:hypothetical protein
VLTKTRPCLNVSSNKHKFDIDFVGAVVEDVRTIFEKRNDATIYIPDMQSIAILG